MIPLPSLGVVAWVDERVTVLTGAIARESNGCKLNQTTRLRGNSDFKLQFLSPLIFLTHGGVVPYIIEFATCQFGE